MRCVFDPRQLAHAPAQELHNGAFVAYAETPARARSVLDAIGPVEAAADHGEAPLRAVHDPAYLDFLRSAYRDWRAAGRAGDAAGYAWPVARRRPLALDRIDARLGAFSFDASSPIAEGTWEGAYWSAQTALTALGHVLGGERTTFALCRPPGHHAGRDYLGGYCHLNNAAIAAEAAGAAGRRVAILDIDYHHGNGTQDIFWDRGDVLFVSIHADPRTDYPFFWGHAEEIGGDEGEGATLNLPLPQGTDLAAYLPVLDKALTRIADFGADLLVTSYGADTFAGDPISFFRLETADYAVIARRIAALKLPSLVVMEGGYAVDALGANVASFLEGLDEGAVPFRKTERALDQLFHSKLVESADFADWLLSRTKFAGAKAKLVNEPWQFQWYRSPTTGTESETDIFLVFETAEGGSRFALHIENKLTTSSFRPRQAELYAERARDWMGRRNYQDFETILIAPKAFRDRHPEQVRVFDRYIAHEDIAAFIPEFA